MLGGTLTELAWLQGRVDQLRVWLQELGLEHVEVSSGTVRIPDEEKPELIRSFAGDFTVCGAAAPARPPRRDRLQRAARAGAGPAGYPAERPRASAGARARTGRARRAPADRLDQQPVPRARDGRDRRG